MSTIIVLFTRDLRLSDHPALHAAVAEAERVVPLFVLDPAVLRVSARNRIAYLVEALADLRGLLRERGGDLVIRRGDTVAETVRTVVETAAVAVHVSEDVSTLAATRTRRLAEAVGAEGARLRTFPGVTVVPPRALRPEHGDHYRIFTPYLRAWESARWRAPLPAPERVALPPLREVGALPGPDLAASGIGALSPHRLRGGITAARDRVRTWSAELARAGSRSEAPEHASRLGCHLRFGCVSPLEVALTVRDRPEGVAFLHRLARRDFHHQVAWAFPRLNRVDYRPCRTRWRRDDSGFAAWCSGTTGIPIVDAGMRQLLREGYLPGGLRTVVATYLTRVLRVHWKRGADHFHSLLVDGDVADNYGNWQWAAGTGASRRPPCRFDPLRQARRQDPDGSYVRRHVPELRGLRGCQVHNPPVPRPGGYPPPLPEP
ncbi:deoxyribodipyrimidine photo-lyase [Thermobifida halotolerans]|uniref:Deoxyribodipyrimidine photo-lyase n=1 Tax=Thermobifida halotolerans TaxID=483545 RepID=A0A399FZW4_9ACTN|nr:deoxyribodipyrimidine photo-lyase [Thermobifida halotolerans]UOE19610.1 deoxyribodipyrimidine photo-lyase [Thermobifida halotolerans]